MMISILNWLLLRRSFLAVHPLMLPVGEEIMDLQRERYEEQDPSQGREDGDVPVLLLFGSHLGRVLRFEHRRIQRGEVAADFLDDGSELSLVGEIGFRIEVCEQFALVDGCGDLFRFLRYPPEHHRRHLLVEQHAGRAQEAVSAFRLVGSSVGLLVRDHDLEVERSVDRYPFAGIEGQIVPVPFQVVGAVEIFLSVEAHHDALLIHAFPDILDVEDEVLVERDPLFGISGIDEVDAWRYDVGLAFRHIGEIQAECRAERIALGRRIRLRTCPQLDGLLAGDGFLEIDLEERFRRSRGFEGRIGHFQDDPVVFYLRGRGSIVGRRQYAEDLKGLRLIIEHQGEFRYLLALRREKDVRGIGASCMELVRRLESRFGIERLEGDFRSSCGS